MSSSLKVEPDDEFMPAQTSEGQPIPEFRLPEDIIPLHYDLDIVTFLGHPTDSLFLFKGNAVIKIKCLKPKNTIKIHAQDLEIDNGKTSIRTESRVDSTQVVVTSSTLDTVNDFYIITTESPLEVEKEYYIDLSFEATLKDDLVGYYRSSYVDRSSGSVKYLAVTHFEPSDARRAFPCFDEPLLKATFHIRLGHHQDLKALSNMPLKSTNPLENFRDEKIANFVWSEFETTPLMSTYLVAFMVSEFEVNEVVQNPKETTFRVWARKDAIDQSAFPALVGPKFLKFYEIFFGKEYSLPKQDLLAIPDFKIGAMENWGMITFRESSLLLDEKTASSIMRLYIASIIAHEIAHMWFGNLVTMRWWTDLWLKEGFATYMAGLAVDYIFPEWNSLDAEALSDLLRVFHLDSLKTSHPVSVVINHPKEISNIFDAISYDKGSFLLRMISLFLGEEVFRAGISAYLLKYQFSNAEKDDLWESLTEQAHRFSVLPKDLTVKKIMDTWTLQTGYPVITVQRQYEQQNVTITQTQYYANKSDIDFDQKAKWWVPLSFSTEKEHNFKDNRPAEWFPRGHKQFSFHLKAEKNEWVIFNNRAAGLYKTNYDQHNWDLLIAALNSPKFEEIDVMNRALLIIDVMDFANCGILDFKVAFSLITYTEREKAFIPWNAALTKLELIKSKLIRTPIYGDFKNFMRRLLKSVVSNLNPMEETTDFEKGRLISLITGWACPLNVGKCGDLAMELFNSWFKGQDSDHNPIPKDIRQVVYSHAVQSGGEEVWNFLWEKYKHANVVAEKNNILKALTNTKEVWLLERFLEWTLDGESGVRKQDAFIIFRLIAAKDVGFYVAQKFFFRNIERVSQYFGATSELIKHYFTAVADQITDSEGYTELKEFAEKNQTLLAPASIAVEQALETVQLNILWMKQHFSDLSTILKDLSHHP